MRRTASQKRQERDSAIRYLSDPESYNIQPGDTIYSVTAYVSQSGMGAAYKFFIVKNGRIIPITYPIARATDTTLKDRYGERVAYVGGTGFNRPYHVISHLAQILFSDPYALKHEGL